MTGGHGALRPTPRARDVPTAAPLPEGRLTELYRAYGPAIYARCRRMLGDGQAAEDATQETFLRICRHLDKVPPATEALAWIYRIATNYCLNEIRDRRTRPEPTADLPDHRHDTLHDVSHRLESALADRNRVERLIAMTPEKLRAAAWLHHVDGLEQGEVARVLGVSRRTVVYRLAQFAKRARRVLGE